MKASRIHYTLLVLVLSMVEVLVLGACSSAYQAEKRSSNQTGQVAPAGGGLPAVNSRNGNGAREGAVPEPSQAEKQRDTEAGYQTQLVGVARAVAGIEDRLAGMRRQANPPARLDMEQADRDVALTEEELNRITISSLSPLTQLQRSDLQDRLFQLRLSMEILKNRWGGSWRIFGMDFFNSATPTQGPDQGPVPANYRIRTGDTLNIQVLSQLGAQNEYHPVVDNTGRVYIQGAGSIYAVGKTAGELRQFVSSKIRSRFKQLRVELAVEKLATIRVQVAGEVAKPGTYALTGLATVLTALYQAGGPTKSGTFRHLSLVREGRPARNIDLYDFLLKGSKGCDVPLEDGDLIFVPAVGGTMVVEGEVVRPGRYEPSFPITLSEALKMAGGASSGGYLQTVQVERVENGEYKVLVSAPLKGSSGKPGFVLKPGDQVTVTAVRSDRTNQVVISGPVGAPGMYGFRDGMKVSDLVKLAQGLDPKVEVYTGRADVLRIDPLKGSEILTFDLARALRGEPEADVALRKLDSVFVYEPDQVVFRPKVVTVVGAVAKPGVYKRTDGMRVSDLIAAAGGVLPDAYLDRADMLRQNGGDTTELVRVTLRSALSGDAAANAKLEDRDQITVLTLNDAGWRDHTVRIEGAVQRPGVYARSSNMRVSDLVFASGGLLPEAAKVAEVAHCAESGESAVARVSLENLAASSADDIPLSDRDIVTIPSVNPTLRAPEIVYITGEVAKPGPYALNSRNDKLTDIFARAGGLTEFADVQGLLFLRQKESFENSQQGKDVDTIVQKSRAFANKQFLTQLAKLGVVLPSQFIQSVQDSSEQSWKPAEVVAEEKLTTTAEGQETEETQKRYSNFSKQTNGRDEELRELEETPSEPNSEEVAKASAMGPRVSEVQIPDTTDQASRREMALLANSARVSVDLTKAFDDPGSPDNISLREGDRIYVPRITNVVTVVGAVLAPHSFAAKGGNSVSYYLQRSGGYAQDAAKGMVIVVRSNGDALPMDRVKSVQAGDTIVVPTTGIIDIAKKWEKVGSVTKVLSDILSSVFILTRF